MLSSSYRIILSCTFSVALLAPAFAEPTPSAYSLNQDGWIGAVTNQGHLGSCWAFADTGMLKSSLLRQGIVTRSQAAELDISQWHTATASGNPLKLTPTYDPKTKQWEYDGWGGMTEGAIAYWTRGQGRWRLHPDYTPLDAGGGIVLVGSDPKDRYPLEALHRLENLAPYVPSAEQSTAPYGIKESIVYKWNGKGADLAAFQEELKKAVLQYGGLAVDIKMTDDFQRITDETPAAISFDKEGSANHLVVITGWDDNKQFTINGKTYTGGWLIQNSWGNDWGVADPASKERGYFWLPFADTSLTNAKLGTALITRTNRYSDGKRVYSPVVLQNQIFSPFNSSDKKGDMLFSATGFEKGVTTFAAGKLKTPGGQNAPSKTTLAAIGLWQANPGTTVSISVFPQWGKDGPAGTPYISNQVVTMNDDGVGGYHEVDLAKPITTAAGNSFYVMVDYGDEEAYPVGIDDFSPKVLVDVKDWTGLSWISPNGSDWYDLSTALKEPSVFFLKGITIFNELGGNGLVSDLMQTSGATTVPRLTFKNSSELFLNWDMEVTSGRITTEGNATLKGVNRTVSTPKSLLFNGPGTLESFVELRAKRHAIFESGHFINSNTLFTETGDLFVSKGAKITNHNGSWIHVSNKPSSFTIPTFFRPGGQINNHGMISGYGWIAANIKNDGVIAPGGSAGKITIWGNYEQTAKGTYLWEAAGKNDFDQLEVSGTATLNGTFRLVGINGFNFEYGQTFFDVLSAQKIKGSFSNIWAPEGFRLRIFPDDTEFSFLLAPSSYTLLATNPSERSLAKALDRYISADSGDKWEVSLTLDALEAKDYGKAFQAIAPYFYQTVTSTGLSLASHQVRTVNQRLDAVRFGSNGLSLQGFGNTPIITESVKDAARKDASNEILIPSPENRWGVWAQATGIFGRNNSTADLPADKFNSGGILIGGDYRWSENLSTGLFAGYHGAFADDDDENKLWQNGGDLGFYAAAQHESGLYGNFVSMTTLSRSRVKRNIEFPNLDRTARSEFNSWALTHLLEGGYDFAVKGFHFGPLASIQHTYFENGSVQERNANSLNLQIDRNSVNSLQTSLGARISRRIEATKSIAFTPELRFFWNYEWLRDSYGTQARLNGGSGPAFTTYSQNPERNTFTTGAGLTATFGSAWTANAYYSADIGSRNTLTHSVSASVGYQF